MPEPTPHPARVLVIDDNPVFLNTLLGLLSRYSGIRVVGAAGSGQEGLMLAHELRPDIVITDIEMPDRTGYELLAALRKEVPEARSIFVTLYDDPAHRLAAQAAGADAYVSKERVFEELGPTLLQLAE